MGKEFENVLSDCLERLLVGGETLEQCLRSYPEQASELRPLLETVSAVKQVSVIQPREEFKSRARYQFRSALADTAAKKSHPVFGWFPRWATVATMVLGILLAGSGTVAAASYSMPDSPLYPVKLATEQVQLKLTPSDVNKAELEIKLVDRRVAEIVYMANKGNARQVEAATNRLDERLVMLTGLVSVLRDDGAPSAMAPALAPAQSENADMQSKSVPAPMPTSTPAPAAEGESPKIMLVPPAPSLEAGGKSQALPEAAEGGARAGVGLSKKEEIKIKVERYAADHPAILREVLEKAPESAKPALRRAIDIAESRYKEALEEAGDD